MKGLICVDVDDTLVKTDSQVIKRYKGKETRLTSEEFAKDIDKGKDDCEYDFEEFSNPTKIRQGILNGKPLIRNLKIVDNYIAKGYDLCFLTARSNEKVVYESLLQFLKVRNKSGELEEVLGHLRKELCVAIDDPKYADMFDESLTHAEKKGEVLKDYCFFFDDVVFIDDDANNVRAAKSLGLENLTVITAKS
jgi:FMN phosphatase YigB (HAD superfamily)